jgi:hypothetical protein
MNLNEYQIKAYETAIYKLKIIYPALELCGECGEFYFKYSLYKKNIVTSKEHIEDIKKEMGDICWAIAALCTDFNLLLEDVFIKQLEHTFIPEDVDCYVDKIIMNSSFIAEIVKKSLRDSNFTFSQKQKEDIMFSLGSILSNIDLIATTLFSTSLDTILQMNLDKLQSRKERNMLQGSGDNR